GSKPRRSEAQHRGHSREFGSRRGGTQRKGQPESNRPPSGGGDQRPGRWTEGACDGFCVIWYFGCHRAGQLGRFGDLRHRGVGDVNDVRCDIGGIRRGERRAGCGSAAHRGQPLGGWPGGLRCRV
ncbi:MAG: hypothetical protein AVDCRST_MAG21-1003, partial [uncultured Nocardioidaceae bacterium]